jgi:hypothetical protein
MIYQFHFLTGPGSWPRRHTDEPLSHQVGSNKKPILLYYSTI